MAENPRRLSVVGVRRLTGSRRSLSCSDLFELEDCLTEEFTCAICRDIIDTPMFTACGHVFCCTCINLALGRSYVCPECRSLLTPDMLYPCYPLKSVIAKIKAIQEKRSNESNALEQKKEKSLSSIEGIVERILNKITQKFGFSINNEDENMQQLIMDISHHLSNIPKRRRSTIGEDLLLVMTFMNVLDEKAHKLGTLRDSWSRCLRMMAKLRGPLFNTYIADSANQNKVSHTASLKQLSETLRKVVRYDEMRKLGSWLMYDQQDIGVSRVITSIAESSSENLLAVSSIGRGIDIFQTSKIDDAETEQSIFGKACIKTRYKPSCVKWFPNKPTTLAFSDYFGYLHIADVTVCSTSMIDATRIQAHRDKCWAIDMTPFMPKLIATASQDCTAKIIDSDYGRAVINIPLPCPCATCCFMPSAHERVIALGLADRAVIAFDLRNTRRALFPPVMHNGPLAYTMFLNENDLLTACAACELRVTSISDGFCKMVMAGHENKRLFVGLSCNEAGFVCCGSEDGFVHIYIPELQVPLISYQTSCYPTSALCFRPKSDMFFCGDRDGVISLIKPIEIPKDHQTVESFKTNLKNRIHHARVFS